MQIMELSDKTQETILREINASMEEEILNINKALTNEVNTAAQEGKIPTLSLSFKVNVRPKGEVTEVETGLTFTVEKISHKRQQYIDENQPELPFGASEVEVNAGQIH